MNLNRLSASILVLSTLLLAGCEKEPFLTVDQPSVTFDAEGGTIQVALSVNRAWTLTSDREWCTATPVDGNGKGEVPLRLTCEPNTTYGQRSCTVRIRAEELQLAILVTQLQNDAIIATPTAFTVDGHACTLRVEVGANISYVAEIDPSCQDWIRAAETRALTYAQPVFEIAECPAADPPRDGRILFRQTDGPLTTVVTVHQEPLSAIVLEETQFELSAEAARLDIPVQANLPFTVSLKPETADWIHILSTAEVRSLTPYVCAVEIGKNQQRSFREAEIVFAPSESGSRVESVSVRIVQYPPLSMLVLEHHASSMAVPLFDGELTQCWIEWGDGVREDWRAGLVHTFASPGPYVTKIGADGAFSSVSIPSMEGITHIDISGF